MTMQVTLFGNGEKGRKVPKRVPSSEKKRPSGFSTKPTIQKIRGRKRGES
jgi:hypothetical protein